MNLTFAKRLAWLTAAVLVIVVSSSDMSLAGVPGAISFQAELTDNVGTPVADGPYQITITIYDAAAAGSALWTSGPQMVQVTGGLFTYNLGSVAPLPDTLFDVDTIRYVGVQVGGDPEMIPRTRLYSSAYAFHARSADRADVFRLLPLNTPGACDGGSRGSVYFDSDLNEPCYCNGTRWVQVDGGGPCDCVDEDADGYDACDPGNPKDTDGQPADCDDADASINPGAAEVCDGVDNNCDGIVDEGCVEICADGLDNDGDGFVDCDDFDCAADPACAGCTDADSDGWTDCAGDCDDGDATVYPGATEVCDGKDNNCDGTVDEGCVEICADGLDNDGDGLVDCDDFDCAADPACAGCTDADSDGWTDCAGDCDDGDATVYPGATEICDGKDNNCDGNVDEGC